MKKIKLLLGALVVIASLGMMAQPSGAYFGDWHQEIGPYHSGGSGASRQCAFFENLFLQWNPQQGHEIQIIGRQEFRQGTNCAGLLTIPGGWSKIVHQVQVPGVLPGTWVNSGAQFTRLQAVSGTGWGLERAFIVDPGYYRVVAGFEVLMQGAARQKLVITPPIFVPEWQMEWQRPIIPPWQ